ncbi:MAG: sigma factor-like helix-turn-helix DNA-binding protein, partial [Spirochaetaceae bacterium]|nr:sigma factor-like helix-turn-helix DNA-binding protein [Spirochaetaceae bacterium]
LILSRAAPPEESRACDEPPWEMERSEGAQALRQALAALGEPAASLVYLRDAEGLSIEELSGAFALREGTVKSKLARGRKRLRELIEREGRRAPRRSP